MKTRIPQDTHSSYTVTDGDKIREILDRYVRDPGCKPEIIVIVFSREHRPGGIEYVGCKPIAAAQTENERVYTFSTSDSGYQSGAYVLSLSKIEYIQMLRN